MGDLDEIAQVAGHRDNSRDDGASATAAPPGFAQTARVWMIHDQGRQFGPHTEMKVAMLLAAGSVSAAALVWREGSPRWIPITAIVPLPAAPSPIAASAISNGNRIAAGISAILVGCLGVHKFILGFTGAGIIMLLVSVVSFGVFAPVVAIIGLIEGVIYLSKSDAEFHRDYVVNKRQWF